MSPEVKAAVARLRYGLTVASQMESRRLRISTRDARLLCDALASIPTYRVSEGHGTTPEEGRLDELAELLITQCNASLYELVAITKLSPGESTDIRGTDDGVAFRVERIS